MFKNQKPEKKNNNITEEKIPWYRRRWVWGVVLGVVLALVCLCGIDILSKINPNSSLQSIIPLFLFQLPIGLFIIGGIKGVEILYEFIDILFYLYLIIYYIGLLILIFITFHRKKVKIKYPFILIVIITTSLFGFIVLSGFS